MKDNSELIKKRGQDFIFKATEFHGQKYNYSKVKYKKSSEKVTIICSIHGEFTQRPNDHLRGKGCVRCGKRSNSQSRRMSIEEIIKKAREIHGEKYNYSELKRTKENKIIVICREHGKFEQKLSKHLQGQGCPGCSHNRKLDTSKFIKESEKIHGQLYDYSETCFEKWDLKLSIKCRSHGYFHQTPNSHLQGHGCPKCGRIITADKLKLSKFEFIEKSLKIHGDSYGYEVSDYLNFDTHVDIFCPKHGNFQQTPRSHLSGAGCPTCARIRTSEFHSYTKEKFIQKAKIVHGISYEYDFVEYQGIFDPVWITCREHGTFKQVPGTHLAGSGCPDCGKLVSIFKRSLTKVEFVERAMLRHGEAYLYEKSEFINANTKILIECGEHGFFEQLPIKHMSGDGCPQCGIEKSAVKRKKSKEEFVSEAILVHENSYDYSMVDYQLAKEPVVIICHNHGRFSQTPDQHIQGSGCPECSRMENDSKGVKLISKMLEDFEIEFEREARFPSCKDKLPLPFDFHLPIFKILIEFDGEQHFKPVEHWGGLEALEGVQRRDRIKTNWAIENNFKLFRISFSNDVLGKIENIVEEIRNI